MPDATRNSAAIIPLDGAETIYVVSAVRLVPEYFTITLPAASPDAACRLASDLIERGFARGVPRPDDASPVGVYDLNRADRHGMIRGGTLPVTVPPDHVPERIVTAMIERYGDRNGGGT